MRDPTTEAARRLESALAMDAELCPCENEEECDCGGAPVESLLQEWPLNPEWETDQIAGDPHDSRHY
jgi:hypothetical protein